ncbi:hypothetical protein [uncultured Sphingomonas sp.]|uniref:hypothetical protein n=1 Tax=uncultured Sphingomonas sp. TaxID=158754 RepID=UPI0035CA6CF4
MSTTGFDLIADGIDANLDHLHKQRWTERAAELHAKADRAEGEAGEQARRALHDHYADRFRPETSRMALLDQAAANQMARVTGERESRGA